MSAVPNAFIPNNNYVAIGGPLDGQTFPLRADCGSAYVKIAGKWTGKYVVIAMDRAEWHPRTDDDADYPPDSFGHVTDRLWHDAEAS